MFFYITVCEELNGNCNDTHFTGTMAVGAVGEGATIRIRDSLDTFFSLTVRMHFTSDVCPRSLRTVAHVDQFLPVNLGVPVLLRICIATSNLHGNIC